MSLPQVPSLNIAVVNRFQERQNLIKEIIAMDKQSKPNPLGSTGGASFYNRSSSIVTKHDYNDNLYLKNVGASVAHKEED